MKNIAIIDDRQDDRDLMEEAMKDAITDLKLEDEWSVIAAEPLSTSQDYIPWIISNRVDILIIDERLFEASNGVLLSGYLGSDVVAKIRETQKRMPIIGVSAQLDSDGLIDKFELFDDIRERHELISKPNLYLQRFIRLQNKMAEENAEQVAELSILSEKIATSQASPEEIERAKVLQEMLALPLTVPLDVDRSRWLNEYKEAIDNVESIEMEIKAYIDKAEQNND